ncbi:transcriptional activator NhaR [Chitinimonas sp. BJYL2]|uniref:transcriptional activator NhaR n=1 Tax=Chitinimonas sp. BJYL2 TaxID=2976696 RepID=UPI0022B4CFA7|nr:transcriptional activator NhaR [Chitinimonas sp. BJYL2]
MNHLNYKHLHYFWMVVKHGGVLRASEQLHLTPQAISGQLRLLDEAMGTPLLRKRGRGLELTDAGRLVLSYADEIFHLGRELQDVLRNYPGGLPQQFRVGVGDMVPKTIAFHLLQPAMSADLPVRLICREGGLMALLADLAIHQLDLVIADRPLPPEANVRAFNHLLGESAISILATADLCRSLTGSFPDCLQDAPWLLPGQDAAIRPRLLAWLERRRLRVRVVAEFDDGALLKAFGKAGMGCFAAPSVLAATICEEYQLQELGRIDELTEQFYAISVERQLRHPAVLAVTNQARNTLFGQAAHTERG